MEELLEYLNNDFAISCEEVSAVFAASTITCTYVNTYKVGQYIRIKGSVLNDGVYRLTAVAPGVLTVAETLVSETATVTLKGLVIPAGVLTLHTDIQALDDSGVTEIQEGDTKVKYSERSAAPWQMRYAARLALYRKLKTL